MSDLIERLRGWAKRDTMMSEFGPDEHIAGIAADELDAKDAEIERLEGDLQVTRLQRDARMVSEFVVDDAVKAEIERLQYEIEKLRFVIELMPCTCRGLETCLRCELLENSDE